MSLIMYGIRFAPDGSEKPGLKNCIFLDKKERPTEAPFLS
jgi:hypothetical protein